MSFLKLLELAFRRCLITVLPLLLKRKKTSPLNPKFNECKFLFLRQDLIGDALVSTPVFEILKQRYPGAIIDVLLSPKNYFVLERDPAVRKRLVYKKGLPGAWDMLKHIRAERYDFVVDLMDNPSATSTTVCLISGARWSVGLQKGNAKAYDILVSMPDKKDFHVVDRTTSVLAAFGIRTEEEKLRIRYHVAPESEKFACDFWRDNSLEGNIVLGINISAGVEERSWWGNNCRQFLREWQRREPAWKTILLCKPADESKIKAIRNELGRDFHCPKTPSFDHLAAVVRKLNFLITPDTSIVQIAAAFQIPAVVLHLRISELHGHLWVPYKSDSENLVASIDNVETIPYTDVLNAFQKLVARHPATELARVYTNNDDEISQTS